MLASNDERMPALATPDVDSNDTEAVSDFVLAKAETHVPART